MYQDNINNSSGYYGQTPSTEAEAQELAVRLGSLCRVYEQTDRVLTQDPIHVHVVDNGQAPAWSDGQDIYINKAEIEFFDLEELVQINGLNYHELAHHLYSPRKGTSMMQWIIENNDRFGGFLNAANILEDQRIETLLTARYPAIVPYLTKTVIRWLADSPETMQTNYVAIRGRQYLPMELRIAFRDQFFMPELIPVAAEIIDEYRTLHFPKQYDRAQELIGRFKEEVLDKMGIPDAPPPTDGGPSGCGKRNPVAKGRPEAGKAQQRDSDRAKGASNPEPVFVYKPAEPGKGDDDKGKRSDSDTDINNPPTSEGVGSGDMPGNDSGDNFKAPTTVQEALDARQTDNMAAPTPGTGHAQSLGGIPDDVAQIMQDIEQSIYDRKDVQTDIKTKQRVIIGGDGKHDDNIRRGKYDTVAAPMGVIASSRRFARELERLKQECEPSWQREMPAGRINVQRIIKGCDIVEAFDRWEEGVDGTDIEAVMLIDRSGSMGSNNNDMRASEAAYVIKRAMEQINSPVTIYSFDEKAEIVADRTQKVDKLRLPFIYGNGGTDPKTALIGAERLLKSSRAKTKILFLVTDGQFSHYGNDDIIKRLNSMGVITVMIMIASEREMQYYRDHYDQRSNDDDMFHECSIRGTVETAADLLPFAKEVVTNTIRKSLRR
jgi:Mg-chelatase subunit ChlD